MTTSSFANPFRPYNPFIATVEEQPLEIEEVEETGHVSYALVQSGPAVAADEVESHLDAVEVKVTWGAQVLSVNHLETGKGFSIGEGGDFVVPNTMKSDVVGVRGGQWFVSVPAGATATVKNRGESPAPLQAGDEIDVREGMRVSIEIEGVTLDVSAVRAGKKFKVGFLASLATGAAAAIGLSFVGHTAIVAAMALFMPSMNADDAEGISREQLLSMQALLDASADREQDRLKEEAAAAADENGGGSQGGEPTKGEAGTAGTANPKMAAGHMAFAGKNDRSQFSRQDELNEIRNSGMVGMLRSAHNELGHTAPWGDEPMGTEAMNAHGAFFGSDIGEVAGSGYALSGTGEGGGGKGEGVGIDGVGNTVGGGGGGPGKWGYGKGDKDGIGNGHGPVRGGHVAKAPPPPREGKVTTNGQLPAEVIQRIVRQNFGRFRLCYEAGLRGNPTLQGRVVTKFVIGRDGSVNQSMDGGSDMPNQEVTSCVVRSFQNLSFPQPDNGIVTVSYPITFSPGE
ncbi:MAG: AgmX/PglI C-terminal domain-containing protein [Labilithrix sp.]|nr:AgmX/PglI C-terminal domain-containing protein [Labilithrix sp.]MCW5810331.1 AgmX/PglI C-terminal domain-containing protein [Labilithrix sp.]